MTIFVRPVDPKHYWTITYCHTAGCKPLRRVKSRPHVGQIAVLRTTCTYSRNNLEQLSLEPFKFVSILFSVKMINYLILAMWSQCVATAV